MRVYDGDSVQASVHVLTAPGNYTISLTVTNARGSSDTSRADYIRITPAGMPVNADFPADILSGPAIHRLELGCNPVMVELWRTRYVG